MHKESNDYKKLCEELWLKYEPGIRNLCLVLLSSKKQEVDDVVSETYLSLVNNLKKGNVIENPRAWLYSVARNIVKGKYTEINKMKETQVSLSDYPSGKEFDIPFDFDILDNIVIEKGNDRIYNEIMDELGEKNVKLLVLTYEKNMKYKDSAKIFDSTEAAIKQRLYRTKKKIRQMAKEKTENFL